MEARLMVSVKRRASRASSLPSIASGRLSENPATAL
jgi:hypothetical protein